MRVTAMYFIDVLALRAGNEKGEDEADNVGCCSLRCEQVTLEPSNYVIFAFLWKDSDGLFDRVNGSVLDGPFGAAYTNAEGLCRFYIAHVRYAGMHAW